MTAREFTVVGVVRTKAAQSVVGVGEALMDSAAERYDDAAVSIDVANHSVEIECVVVGDGLLEGLAYGKRLVQQICDGAQLPSGTGDSDKPVATEWRVVEESEALDVTS